MSVITPTFSGFPEFLTPGRLSTAQYLRMIETGVLGPQDKVELIEGMIVQMSPAGIPHNYFLINIVELMVPLVGQFKLAIQGTLTVADGHVYDPDVMLLRPRADRFKTKLPDSADVLLVIEASQSSLPRDQKVKLPVYARAGIAEYWIADLEREILIVHRNPQGENYQSTESHSGDDVVSPLAAPDFSFAVRQAFD